jgi:tryptophan-rich sensory protein
MSTPFESVDLVRGVIYAGFWFWQWTSSTGSSSRRWYGRIREKAVCAPPGWFFGVTWAVLYSLLGVSTYLYDRNFSTAGGYHTAVLWLVLANALFNKLWSLAFFDRGMAFTALLILALAILPTAVLIPVFMALDGAWVSFGLWLAYPVWLLVALYLNWVAFRYQLPTKDAQKQLLPVTTADAAAGVGAPLQRRVSQPARTTLVFDYDQ